MKLLTIIVVISVFFSSVGSYNILMLLASIGKSHSFVFHPIVRGLKSKNHNITVVSFFPTGMQQDDNFRELILKHPSQGTNIVNVIPDRNVKIEQMSIASIMEEKAKRDCNFTLHSPLVQNLMKSDDRYDIIISEFFNNDCLFTFAHKFKAPVVGVSSTSIFPWHNSRFANIDNPSYIPNPLYLYSDKMTFIERLENFLCVQIHKYVYDFFITKNDEWFARHLFNVSDISMKDLINQYTSLILVNSHFSVNFARPFVPGVVEVGGIHVPQQPKKLPENIEKFINESTHGVIYFSLGSMIKGHTFPEEKRQEFLKAFARLPQRVLWKWENETMPGKPDNIMIQKWMPQFDILSHPNVKAFISHAGLLGTTEAVHCGVPMLLMPQYGDQHTNARAVEANGGGIVLYLKDVTEEKVYESLKTLMSPEFTAKTKALSERFRDRPMSPMDTAIYWIEYVARHKGAPHLKTAAVDMPLYQYLLLDVIGFLALIFLAFSYIVYKIIRLIYRAIFSKNKVKKN